MYKMCICDLYQYISGSECISFERLGDEVCGKECVKSYKVDARPILFLIQLMISLEIWL